MPENQKTIVWFDEVTREDIPLVGGKGANLGEMTNAQIPVPPGFVVTANAYFDFVKKNNINDKIRSLLEPLDPDDSKQLQQVSDDLRGVPGGHPQRDRQGLGCLLQTVREVAEDLLRFRGCPGCSCGLQTRRDPLDVLLPLR